MSKNQVGTCKRANSGDVFLASPVIRLSRYSKLQIARLHICTHCSSFYYHGGHSKQLVYLNVAPHVICIQVQKVSQVQVCSVNTPPFKPVISPWLRFVMVLLFKTNFLLIFFVFMEIILL